MRTRTRRWPFGPGVAATGFAVLLCLLLLLPAVQSGLLRTAAGAIEGVALEFDFIHVAPWGASLRNLRLQTRTFKLEAGDAQVEVDLWGSLGGLQLDIERISATDINLELKHREALAEPEHRDAKPFDGLSPLLRWPARLKLDSLSASGHLSTDPSQPKRLAGPWRLEMNEWSARSVGNLQADTEISLTSDGDPVGKVSGQAQASADIADNGMIQALTANLKMTPNGENREPQLAARLQLDLGATQETGHLDVSGPGGQAVARLDAAYDREAGGGAADWQVDLERGILAAFLRNEIDADLSGNSNGKLEVDLRTPSLRLKSSLHAEGRGWKRLDPRLAKWDEVSVAGDTLVSGWAKHWTAERFEAQLHLPDGREALRIDLLLPTAIELDGIKLSSERWNEPILQLSASDFPLAWLRAFDPAAIFQGGQLDGTLLVVPVARRHVRLLAEEPLHLSELQLRPQIERTLPVFDLVLTPRIELEHGELSAQIANLLLTAPNGLSVKFNGQANTSRSSWPLVDLTGGVSLRAPFFQKHLSDLQSIRGMTTLQLDLGELTLAVEIAALAARSSNKDVLMSLKLDGDGPLLLTLPELVPDWDNYRPQELQLKFDGLPIAWLSPFLPEIELRSGALYGELLAAAAPDAGIILETHEPFELRDARPFYRGQRVASSLSMSMSPRLNLSNQGGTLQLKGISMRSRGNDRLDGEISLDWRAERPAFIATKLDFDGFFPSVTERIGKIGEMSWRQQGGFNLADGDYQIDRLAVSLTDMMGTRFMQLHNLKPFGIATEPFGFTAEGGPSRVLKATLRPLELQRLVPKLWSLDLAGLLPEGEFYGYVDSRGRLVVKAEQPLVFDDVTLRWDEATLVEKIEVGLRYEVAYSVNGLEARQIDLAAANHQGESLATVSLKAVAPLTEYQTLRSLDLTVDAALANLAGQPIFDGVEVLDSGRLRGKLNLINGQTPLIRASASLEGASTTKLGRLADVEMSFKADGKRGDQLVVELPFRMQSGRGDSDLSFSGVVSKRNQGYRFNAQLTGAQLIAPDLRQLHSLILKQDEDAQPAAQSEQPAGRSALTQLRQQRDANPFWSDHLRGKATVNLDRLQLEKFSVDGIKGRLQVLPSSVTLNSVRASLLEGRLASSGTINYRTERDRPYDMNFKLRAHDLQIAGLLPPPGPGQKPLVEGLFNLATELKGTGRNALDLAIGTFGDIDLHGRDGVFRGMAGRGSAASKAASVAGALTFSSELKAIGRMLDDLQEIRFSQLKLSLLRESKNKLKLDQFSMASPLLRADGQGTLKVIPGKTLEQGPMNASVQLGTRGDMSILFGGMGLLEEGSDPVGYRSMKQPIEIDGTLAEPDTSALWDLLDQAAGNSRGSFGLGLKTINRKLKKSQIAGAR